MDSVGYSALSGLGIVVVNQLANLTIKWRKEKSEERKRLLSVERDQLEQDRKDKAAEADQSRKDRETEQKRKWDLEDQDRRARQMATDLTRHATEQTAQVLDKIAENTAVNLDQINVSNDYNAKIAVNSAEIALLHVQMARMAEDVAAIRETLDAR